MQNLVESLDYLRIYIYNFATIVQDILPENNEMIDRLINCNIETKIDRNDQTVISPLLSKRESSKTA